MNIFALFSLFASVLSIYLGNFVYHLDKKKLLNKIFMFFSLSLSYWAFTEFMYRQADSPDTAYLWLKIGVFWPFVFSFFIHFTLAFTEKEKLLENKLTYFLIYVPAAIFSAIELTTNLMTAGPAKKFWGYTYAIPEDLWLFWVSDIWAFGLAFLALFLCVGYYFKVTDKKKKQQAKYVSIGFSIPLFAGLLTEGLAPLLQLEIPELSVTFTTGLAFFVAYAIWKYELFTLSPATATENIISTMPDFLILADPKGKILTVNRSMLNILGYKENELVGKSADTLFVEERFRSEMLRKLLKDGVLKNYETKWKTKSGEEIQVSFSGSVVRSKEGQIVGIVGVIRDITERKKAEEELISLSSAVKMSTDSIVIGDLDAKIIDVNEATLKMYGTDDKRDLIGKNSFDLIAPEDREKALAGMKAVLEKGYVKSREYRVITKDGSRIPVEMNTALMRDADGKPIGFVAISRDISERKRAEEALRAWGERYRSLVELAPDSIMTFDLKGVVTSCNTASTRMSGYSKDELVGKHFAKVGVLRARDIPKYLKMLPSTVKGKVPEPFEVIYQRKDGTLAVGEVHISLMKEGGKTIGIQAIMRDITERKQMEEKLRQYSEHLEELIQKRTEELLESEKRYSVLVEEASDGVVILQDGKIVFANKKAAPEIVGYSRDELIGMPFEKLVDEEYLQLVKERYERRLRGEKVPSTYELEFIAESGERVPVELSATLINYRGRLADLIIMRDIKERKRMEEERLRLEKLAAIGELATMVGHDLRNPLQSIENATFVITNEMSQCAGTHSLLIPQKAMEMLQIINDSVNYADKVIRDLQDFSTTRKPILKETNINTIVKETLSLVETPENVELVTELRLLPWIKADDGMIKRVFLNLVTNGIQAMKNGGTLKVSTKKTRNFIEVSFKDTGVGISEENMKKIFIPFFTTKAKGMGMGLPICKKFVEAHGGNIEVESKEGKGSIFTVKLPIQQENGGEKT